MGQMPDDAAKLNLDESGPFDLAERLARYRARVKREGRRTAVEQLDRAIDEARRDRPRTSP
jgi:hypothetical protein